jgi:uncharacterized protein (DUF934 family)
MPLIDIHGAALDDQDAPTVQLAPDAKLEAIVPRLGEIGRIEIEFPKFRDGRGFTLARTLRERFGYKGDIRATGHFLPDQFSFLQACGFTSFVTPPEHAPAQFAAVAHAAHQPGQLLRRMVARAREG